jgi:hypothetical protein
VTIKPGEEVPIPTQRPRPEPTGPASY